ncbi:HupE/UreJ family protein [Pyxidicoccus xibeiensis]|uniref:HupE/UreJ family protein n=1 Tax=Pyxidicoccus xibeiensis TaxID=2906759 RepID=UPI0020A7E0AC|nr:HupE/UreJ family protein [Pyxidicoccus xibeiensis]MCP3143195.1 HupE/UreJ family protein [Pyxidicoccus xibeiensis]
MALAGLGSGALHALSGPDHLLSLAPLSVGRRHGAWRVGLLWGIGHGLGTLAASAVLMLVVSAVHLEGVERWAERIAALALMGMGVWGLRRRALAGSPEAATRGVVVVGLIHGLTGAAALLLILPAVVSGSMADRVLFLGGFSIGSTLAMSALTAVLASVSQSGRVPATVSTHVPRVASALSVVLGSAWMVGSL